MELYTAITIGPILKTLGLARKPKELWTASYMFSCLMECIIKRVDDKNVILSPAVFDKDEKIGVGLYPDRLFIKGEVDMKKIITDAIEEFALISELKSEVIHDYFNFMYLSNEYGCEKDAIKGLNGQLDKLEWINMPKGKLNAIQNVLEKRIDSPFFEDAFQKGNFPSETLAEIATNEIKVTHPIEWRIAFKPGLTSETDEDCFNNLRKKIGEKTLKSHHKYICVIQADGDNMGKTVSNLPDGEIKVISRELLDFGKKASELIRKYGGLPIYAGGDDLLFIAPVVSQVNGTKVSIFDLLKSIDEKYANITSKVNVFNLKDHEGNTITTSMSYGVSISYFKFPLFEALESARDLLFNKAKNVKGKNSIALKLQKHSGVTLNGKFSISGETSSSTSQIFQVFINLIQLSVEETLISAISHKLKANETILEVILKSALSDKRLDAFFDTYLEFNSKSENEKKYLNAIKKLLPIFYRIEDVDYKDKKRDGKIASEKEIIKNTVTEVYGMLRIAKFINGEEDKND